LSNITITRSPSVQSRKCIERRFLAGCEKRFLAGPGISSFGDNR
jgi:hypothetical protein